MTAPAPTNATADTDPDPVADADPLKDPTNSHTEIFQKVCDLGNIYGYNDCKIAAIFESFLAWKNNVYCKDKYETLSILRRSFVDSNYEEK